MTEEQENGIHPECSECPLSSGKAVQLARIYSIHVPLSLGQNSARVQNTAVHIHQDRTKAARMKKCIITL